MTTNDIVLLIWGVGMVISAVGMYYAMVRDGAYGADHLSYAMFALILATVWFFTVPVLLYCVWIGRRMEEEVRRERT